MGRMKRIGREAVWGRSSTVRANLDQEITDKIFAELERGCVPWVQPWGKTGINARVGLPRNAATGRRYTIPQAGGSRSP
jgi:antirestriction protein ArdC